MKDKQEQSVILELRVTEMKVLGQKFMMNFKVNFQTRIPYLLKMSMELMCFFLFMRCYLRS